MRRLSATTAPAQLGPGDSAIVVNGSNGGSFTAEKGFRCETVQVVVFGGQLRIRTAGDHLGQPAWHHTGNRWPVAHWSAESFEHQFRSHPP